jgi:hypothetical protein
LGVVTKLTPGETVTSFFLDPTNDVGYSVRCDVMGKNGTASDYITFSWQNMEQTEWAFPRFMYGDSNDVKYINPVPYLSTCGPKTFTVEGYIWTERCFIENFFVNALNANGKACVGVAAPVPVKAPFATPATIPVAVPSTAPIQSPVDVPIQVVSAAPSRAPVNVPVKDPTMAPIFVPIAAPGKAKMMAHGKAPIPVNTPNTAAKKMGMRSLRS